VIAGDLTESEARSLGEKYFGSWKKAGKRASIPQAHTNPSQNIYLVDKSGSAQTMLIAATTGVSRSTPDYARLEVSNAILGGLFSSRVNMNLRERNGYTYGAFSFFDYRRGTGPFFVGSSVRTDTTSDALREMFREIAGMQTNPATPAELQMAKDATSRSLAGLFETMRQSVSTTSQFFVYDLPLDFYNTLPAKVDAVTAADVARISKQYFVPEKMFIVAVGDRQKIEGGLQQLPLGKIQLTSFDGTPTETTKAAGSSQ